MSIAHGAFSAGALPAATATYFWLYRRETRAFVTGISAVTLAVIVHIFVVAILAHASARSGLVAAAVEVLICMVVLVAAPRYLGRRVAPL
jgi:hypothetical protein